MSSSKITVSAKVVVITGASMGIGEAIAKHARKGDQLIVQAQIRANNWIDREGKKHYDHSNVIQNFRFGAPGRAKRESFAGRHSESEIGALETEI